MSIFRAPRLRVLVLEASACARLRMNAEAAIVNAGHRVVDYPADADVLLHCGVMDSDSQTVADRIWDQLPFPKHRATVTDPGQLTGILATAGVAVADTVAQRRAAASPPSRARRSDGHAAEQHGGDSGPSQGDHEMSMTGPGGYPLASGAGDRDGLEMDVLHRRLGPFLPAWPAGLVVDVTLAGDTITAASVVSAGVDSSPSAPEEPCDVAALDLDRAATILRLVGWESAASRTLHIRDLSLQQRDEDAQRMIRALLRRVRRSVVLRWSIRGLSVRGSTSVRMVLLERLTRAEHTLDGHRSQLEPSTPSSAVPALICGTDIGTARLLIAALRLRAQSPSIAFPSELPDPPEHHA